MRKFTILFLSVFLFSACAVIGGPVEELSDYQTFTDEEYGVSFEYPAHWESREMHETTVSFASNFNYNDGLEESSASKELEGSLSYSVVPNDSGLDIIEHYKEGLMVIDMNEWTHTEFEGFSAYESDWYPTPESGETIKVFRVDKNDDLSAFISLYVVRTSLTDVDFIESVFERAVQTLEMN